MSPVPALILAALFRIFGIYSRNAAIASLLINGLFATLTLLPLYSIASQLFQRRIAYAAVWVWALHPIGIFISSTRVWGEPLDALLVTSLIALGVGLMRPRPPMYWASLGAVAGLAILANPNTLSMIPIAGFALYRYSTDTARRGMQLCLASGALIAVVMPWLIRNQMQFGEFISIKSNFWLEAEIGNNAEAGALLVDWTRHPASNDSEFREYARLGEGEYMRGKRAAALSWIQSHPAEFGILTIRRMVFWWTGYWSQDPRYLATEPMRGGFLVFNTILTLLLAAGLFTLRGGRWARGLLAGLIVSQSAVYSVTHPAPEYRHAVEPLLTLLIASGGLAAVRFLAAVLERYADRLQLRMAGDWMYARRELLGCLFIGCLAWSLDSLMHVLEDHGHGASLAQWMSELATPDLIPFALRFLTLASSVAVGGMLLRMRRRTESKLRDFPG